MADTFREECERRLVSHGGAVVGDDILQQKSTYPLKSSNNAKFPLGVRASCVRTYQRDSLAELARLFMKR